MEMKNAKLLARFPRDRKRWNAIVFLFNAFLKRKAQEMGLESLTSSSWPGLPSLPLPASARPSSPPVIPGPGGAGRQYSCRGPRGGRQNSASRAGPEVPRLSLFRPCRPHGPYTSQVPPQNPGRQLHLLPKAQTPAPARTRSEQMRPKQTPPCWRRRVSGSFQRERFMERGLRDPGCPAGALALWAM